MSEAATSPPPDEVEERDNTPFLEPKISEKYALSWPHVLACGFFAILFAVFNHLPLFHSDLWGHVGYGHWILEHSTLTDLQLPEFDPFAPLADGVPMVNTAWLSQVLFATIESAGGPEWLSNWFALIVTATYAVLFLALYLQTGRVGVALTGTLLVLGLASTRILVIRTEIFGALCCALLILILVLMRKRGVYRDGNKEDAGKTPWAIYITLPLLMIFWANAHGSFVVGLALLGCHFLGRVIDVLWHERNIGAVFNDVMTRRWLILCELAAASALINPYGIDLYIHTFAFGSNPNLNTVVEWLEMYSRAGEGYCLMFSVALMLVLFRHSRVRIRPADVLILGMLALAVWFSIRMSVWYAYAFGLIITPHIAELVGRKWPVQRGIASENEMLIDKRVFGRTYIHTLVCVVLLWMGFGLAPISFSVLGGERKNIYDKGTPTAVTEFLREHPPEGQLYNPQYWGDWLAWDGPENLKVMTTTNTVHVLPPQVWQDYRRISATGNGWLGVIQKYNIDTLIIDKDDQTRLARQARRLPAEWRIVYEDDRAMIVSRDDAMRASVAKAVAKRRKAQKRKAAKKTN